jgi:hypothetical protein
MFFGLLPQAASRVGIVDVFGPFDGWEGLLTVAALPFDHTAGCRT